MVSASLRVAVVILALQESPGRISSGGFVWATTTLKSFASWLEVVLCDAARPEERRIAVLPISITLPAKDLSGIASIFTATGWPSWTLTISVSSTFTSAVINDISAIVMIVEAA